MPEDPLNTGGTPPAVVRNEPREFVCGACGCRLARNGEILSTGDAYKKFLKHDQVLEEKDREITSLQAEVNHLKDELRKATETGSPGGATSRHRPGSRVS